MLKIGEFSKLSRVSVRMLRHYDEIGLLKPAEIDRFTEYHHVSPHETGIVLSDKNIDGHINVDYEVGNLDGKYGKASNAEIIAYVADNFDLNIFPAHIAQVRGKAGIKERTSYRLGTGKAKPRTCPPEKEEAIMDAFRHFHMI